MHFGLSDEQRELAATVRSLLARRADSAAVRTAARSEEGFDPALWETLCEQIGAAALAVPEEYGGAGFTTFETGVVLEELGRSLTPSPLLASVVAAEALLAAGDAEACARLLPRIAAGEVATLAWSGTAGMPAATEPVRAEEGALTGAVDHVLFGAQATVLLVAAAGPGGPVLHEVNPTQVEVTRTPAMDTTQQLARLSFDAVRAEPIGGDGPAALARAHRAGAVGVASLQLGCLQRALDMTVEHTGEREQFGRPIGSFQALKHRMADMLVQVEMSRSATWAASYAVASGAADADELTTAAASYCGDALMHVAGEAVQMHGGIAITWEHDAQMVLKRAHALNQLFGLPHEHRARLPL